MIMALQRERGRGEKSEKVHTDRTLFSLFSYCTQTAGISQLISKSIGRGLHDAAVCKVNPRGHKKLLHLRSFPMSIKLHTLWRARVNYAVISFTLWSAGESFFFFSSSLTCYLQHWQRRVSPLNEWQIRHNTHQRWHMTPFPFQLGHPEIKREKNQSKNKRPQNLSGLRAHFVSHHPE